MADSAVRVSKLRIFISYAVRDGSNKARQAAQILRNAGHDVWVWDHNKTLGGLCWREIADCIINGSDLLLYICTASSQASWGQGMEAGYALNNRKKTIVICLDNASVPLELTARWYAKLPSSQFRRKIENIAADLPGIAKRIQRLEDSVRATRLDDTT